MRCPYCAYPESKVIDSRPTDENNSIRRRRECLSCGKRFTTYEIIESVPVIVVKKDKSREVFKMLSSSHPYIMGFIKFALLATAGELIASSIRAGKANVPVKIVARFVIWGLIGVWITFMMKVFSSAAASLMAQGIIPGKDNAFLRALYTSVFMNTSFGPTFMAFHKCTDQWLLLKHQKEDSSLPSVIKSIDWTGFVSFTIFKTVPIFWIPAHTVTFMLPGQYQVMMAAALSLVLGLILSLSSKKAK